MGYNRQLEFRIGDNVRKNTLICILAILFFCSSCTGRSLSSESSFFQDDQHKITEQDAAEIVKLQVGDNAGSRKFDTDSVTIDGVLYFRVHVYSLGPVQTYTGTEYQQTFTLGWFYVESKTGEIFVDSVNSLIPYESGKKTDK